MAEPDPSNAGTQSCGYSYETRARPPLNAPCILTDQGGTTPVPGSSGVDYQGAVRSALLDCTKDGTGVVRGCQSATSDKGSILESRVCPIGQCNADCKVGAWTSYTPCSQTCGTGTQRRKRRVTQSPGGTGLPCPHLVESRNCRAAECDADCAVGDFGAWGRCLPVTTSSSQAVISAASGKSSSASCSRKRTRPVIINRAGVGAACPSLQEFKNCQCPLGATGPVLRQAAARKTGGANILNTSIPWMGNSSNATNLTTWLAGVSGFMKPATDGSSWFYQKYSVLGCIAVAVVLIACCCCCAGLCLFLLHKGTKKTRKVADTFDEVKTGRSTGTARMANEEEETDGAPLLSERPPEFTAKAREQQPMSEWRSEAALPPSPYGPDYSVAPLAWQEAAAIYGGAPRPTLGYADPYVGTPAYTSSYPGGGGYGSRLGARYVDPAPYGGLLDPAPSRGYIVDSRPGPASLLDYAPQPLYPPTPQIYDQPQAYSRGRL